MAHMLQQVGTEGRATSLRKVLASSRESWAWESIEEYILWESGAHCDHDSSTIRSGGSFSVSGSSDRCIHRISSAMSIRTHRELLLGA